MISIIFHSTVVFKPTQSYFCFRLVVDHISSIRQVITVLTTMGKTGNMLPGDDELLNLQIFWTEFEV